MEQNECVFLTEEDLIRIPTEDALSICQAAALDDEASMLLHADDNPKDYLERLLQAGRDMDALTFLAYALPKRELIWWACVAFRQHLGRGASEQDERALEVAEAWVYDPNQDLCYAAGDVAGENEFRTPTALIAASVYWAGNSIAPPDCPNVPPREDLPNKGIVSAITLHLIAATDAVVRENLTRMFLSTGIRIAQGATSKAALLGFAYNGSLPIETTE